MKDWLIAATCVACLAALPVGLLLLSTGSPLANFLIGLGAVCWVLPGTRGLLNDVRKHGVHNDRW